MHERDLNMFDMFTNTHFTLSNILSFNYKNKN